MDQEIQRAYGEAKRFDEGQLCQSAEYQALERQRIGLEEQLMEALPPETVPTLEELILTLYDICESECLHFFQQGYLAGKRAPKT